MSNLVSDIEMHPLDELEQQIQEQGLVVIDDVTRMPTYNTPYISPHMVISLNMQGWVRAEYDMRPVEFCPHEISVIYPNHIVMASESSHDYRAQLVVISNVFLDEIKTFTSYRHSLLYHHSPSFMLTDEQFETVCQITNLLRTVSRQKYGLRTRVIADLLEVLSMMLSEYRKLQADGNGRLSSADKLFSRFYDAIVEHYRESREVRFYANLLCLSPKYFGSVIKSETGISASDWIANYVVIQAKLLISSRYDLSIQQISNMLGFSDQAAFSRYFKGIVGISPSVFRGQRFMQVKVRTEG